MTAHTTSPTTIVDDRVTQLQTALSELQGEWASLRHSDTTTRHELGRVCEKVQSCVQQINLETQAQETLPSAVGRCRIWQPAMMDGAVEQEQLRADGPSDGPSTSGNRVSPQMPNIRVEVACS
jgi:hypothetical protein